MLRKTIIYVFRDLGQLVEQCIAVSQEEPILLVPKL